MPAAAVGLFLDALEPEELSVAAFEEAPVDGYAGDLWRIELLHETEPDQRLLAGRLAPLAQQAGLGRLDLTVVPVPREDWLARTTTDFPPQRIGRFWVHGSHVSDPPPEGSEPIHIDAGMAFGSGEHGSTRGCLRVVDVLARHRRFKRVLDLGCGSGILGIAAAKCWPARVVAVDDDPSSIEVAAANAEHNGVGGRIRCVQAAGFAHPLIRTAGPFDLLLANILADPLCDLARGVARHLAAGGIAVLSGLIERQADAVLAAYRRVGLRVVARVPVGPWVTLVLVAGWPGPSRISPMWFAAASADGDGA